MPEVSVILPTYNRAHLVRRAIKSVLDQTFRDFELIIVNDNSSDNTDDVIKKINDTRIKIIQNSINLGPAGSRNIGIRNAQGTFISFIDSDDEWYPEKLRLQLETFARSDTKTGMVYCKSCLVKDGKTKPYLPYRSIKNKEGNILPDILRQSFIDTPAVLIRSSVFNTVDVFDEELKILEDYELFIRVASSYNIKLTNEILLKSHYTKGGVNDKSLDEHAKALEYIYRKNLNLYSANPSIIPDKQLQIADLYIRSGKVQEGINSLKEIDSPPNKKILAHLLIMTIENMNSLNMYRFLMRTVSYLNRISNIF